MELPVDLKSLITKLSMVAVVVACLLIFEAAKISSVQINIVRFENNHASEVGGGFSPMFN